MARKPCPSSFRALAALVGWCAGRFLYARRFVLIRRRAPALKASELNLLNRLKKWLKGVLMAHVNGNSAGCLFDMRKVTRWIV